MLDRIIFLQSERGAKRKKMCRGFLITIPHDVCSPFILSALFLFLFFLPSFATSDYNEYPCPHELLTFTLFSSAPFIISFTPWCHVSKNFQPHPGFWGFVSLVCDSLSLSLSVYVWLSCIIIISCYFRKDSLRIVMFELMTLAIFTWLLRHHLKDGADDDDAPDDDQWSDPSILSTHHWWSGPCSISRRCCIMMLMI